MFAWNKHQKERETLDSLVDTMNINEIREATLNVQEFPEGTKRYVSASTDYEPGFITKEEQKLIDEEKEYQVTRLKIKDDGIPSLEITDRFTFNTTFRLYNNQKYLLNLNEASRMLAENKVDMNELTSTFNKCLNEFTQR